MSCGIGDYTFRLAQHLSLKTRVAILTSVNSADHEKDNGVIVMRVMRNWQLRSLWTLIAAIWRSRAEVVHIQYPTQGYARGYLPYLVPLICFILRKTVVQTWHEIYTKRDHRYILPAAIVPGGRIFVRTNYRAQTSRLINRLCESCLEMTIQNTSSIPQSKLTELQATSMRAATAGKQSRIIVFFGFLYPHKGADLVFKIADPQTDMLLFIGPLDPNDSYHKKLLHRANQPDWREKVQFLGFLPEDQVANYLRIADATLLPFRAGGGGWNTSIHAALLNGCPVVTTGHHGDSSLGERIFFSRPLDISDLKEKLNLAIQSYPITTRALSVSTHTWDHIANSHYEFYGRLLAKGQM